MQYDTEVTISLPRDRVIEHFDSFENQKEWQTGFVSYEPISGEPLKAEARTRLVYNMNGKNSEMTLTVLKRNLPDEFNATYESKGLRNYVANTFVDNGETTTWRMATACKFSGMMAILNMFSSGALKKQTLSEMNKFKAYAEGKG